MLLSPTSNWVILVFAGRLYADSGNSLSLYDLFKRDDDTFEWGAIGDSWATEVAAKTADEYVPGQNKDNSCLRTNYAYGPQLEQDSTWTHGLTENFHFAACSGKHLSDMAKDQNQMKDTGKPHLVTMTAGGNNAGFYEIAVNCIFQHLNQDYGPEYADDYDGVGECANSIKKSYEYITSTGDFDDIGYNLNTHGNLFLYVTGYATFFAVDNDWCDRESFGALPFRKPKLTLPLRKAFNNLTDSLNSVYSKIVADYPHLGIRFVNITKGFDGHRFCEAKPAWRPDWWWHNHQYYSSDVWLWNLSPPFTDVYDESTNVSSEAHIQGDLFASDTPGWQQRPFHPKAPGYTSIKDAIIAQMKLDNVPQSEPQCNDPKPGISPSVEQAQDMNWDLDSRGTEQCCGGEADCNNISTDGGVAVDICNTSACIPCAAAANYVAGLIATCTRNGMVSGVQNLNGQSGSMQI
ncbi:MAG: hypothetical protein Q9181_004270 [Wetmoreana brouardii]